MPHSPPHEVESAADPSAEDGLYTAQDLFGDLVDAPLESSAQPARGSGRVKVQVAEKNRPEALHEKKGVEIPADEMAGLVDAFGGDAPKEHRSEPESEPLVDPPRGSKSPIAAGSDDVDSLLGRLDPVGPAPTTDDAALLDDEVPLQIEVTSEEEAIEAEASPPPVAETPRRAGRAPREAEDFGDLLDNLRESAPEEPPFEARQEAPLPEPETHAALESLDIEAEVPEPEPPAEIADAAASIESAPRHGEADLDQLLSGFLQEAQPAPAEPGRTRTKISVEAPKAARETAPMLDLGALADEALSATLAETREPAGRGARTAPPAEFGPYRLLERIASGGMAEVFRAKRAGVEGFEKVVAVKRILPHLSDNKEFVEMFIDEAKMVAGLSHPNIVQIFDLGKIDAMYFIAMEYVHGKDLRTILKQAKEKGLRIPLDLSVLVVSRVCSALEYAHRKRDEQGEALRIVHRDISPQNILISFEGEVKLTDFGIAKATTKASSTDRGALRGKLLYMSPEQASGHPMDRRSDVFSLGVVFYEMITDTKPFLGSSEKGILEMVRDCRVEPPRSLNTKIPESIERVVMKALEKDPDQRYQDASEMYRGLERVLRERQPPAASELARFMEVLFETGTARGHERDVADEGIEIDLGTEPGKPQREGSGGDEDIDFDDLIKGIGK